MCNLNSEASSESAQSANIPSSQEIPSKATTLSYYQIEQLKRFKLALDDLDKRVEISKKKSRWKKLFKKYY